MLKAKAKKGVLAQGRVRGVTLMVNEEILASMGIGKGEDAQDGGEVVVLTDNRVIQMSGSESSRRTSFAAIEDISAVEITSQPAGGYGSFVWAGLAFVVSAALWRIIENQTISIGAAVIVALMGVYLIYDRLTSGGEHVLVFKTNGGEIRIDLKGERNQEEAEALIARMFELKAERSLSKYARANSFAPR
jgi:hypothetical protein